MEIKTKKQIIEFFLKNGLLLSQGAIDFLKDKDLQEELENLITKVDTKKFILISKDILEHFKDLDEVNINWLDFDKAKVLVEKNKSSKMYEKFIDHLSQEKKQLETTENKVDISLEAIHKDYLKDKVKTLESYEEDSKKRDVQDFITYFNNRFKELKEILLERNELKNLMSIQRIKNKRDREKISIIGIVMEIKTTKNDNLIITLEDTTGTIKVLINKTRPELFEKGKYIVLDEVIGISGVNGENIIFADDLIFPDIPLTKNFKKSPNEEYMIILSDLHVGNNTFMREEFEKFLKWIRGEIGNEVQKDVAKKVKYIVVAGDIVEGAGIYPNQEDDLDIQNIYEQYQESARLLSRIPKDKIIIISPGNHDAMRISEPQPPLYKDFAEELWKLPNVVMVSNPSTIKIGQTRNFEGFDILIYHGYSYDYYADNVESIRLLEPSISDRADLIMKLLLQKRHLAPSHTSTLYIPETKLDPLIIRKIPDFFISGHIHKSKISSYRNINIISGSCWYPISEFQEKVGHVPEPCRVPLINLKNRKIKMMNFSKQEE